MWEEEDQIMNPCRSALVFLFHMKRVFHVKGCGTPWFIAWMIWTKEDVDPRRMWTQGMWAPFGHHPLDFNISGVSLTETGLKVDDDCGTHCLT